ncbi:hypothetical protein Gogos_004963, partial [Gossypium gossypioides]|nr:hypothetical protein [Gossypium gossypioides]
MLLWVAVHWGNSEDESVLVSISFVFPSWFGSHWSIFLIGACYVPGHGVSPETCVFCCKFQFGVVPSLKAKGGGLFVTELCFGGRLFPLRVSAFLGSWVVLVFRLLAGCLVEEEATQVVELNKSSLDFNGHEAWAVGRVMSTEKINREGMYRVLKSIWFTKEPVTFVSIPEGHFLVKFGSLEDRTRIFNMSHCLFDQCLFSMLPFVESDESDLKFGNWLRVKLGQSNSYGGIWPNGVEILRNDVASKMDDEKRGWIGEEEYEAEKGKGKLRVGEEVSDSSSLNDRRPRGIPKEGRSRIR